MAVTVEVAGGPKTSVNWSQGLSGHAALELAYDAIKDNKKLTYALQYWGSGLGYLVLMINGTYDTDGSSSHPYYYWDILVNDKSSPMGLDRIVLKDGDKLSFKYDLFNPATSQSFSMTTKFKASLAG